MKKNKKNIYIISYLAKEIGKQFPLHYIDYVEGKEEKDAILNLKKERILTYIYDVELFSNTNTIQQQEWNKLIK